MCGKDGNVAWFSSNFRSRLNRGLSFRDLTSVLALICASCAVRVREVFLAFVHRKPLNREPLNSAPYAAFGSAAFLPSFPKERSLGGSFPASEEDALVRHSAHAAEDASLKPCTLNS